MTVYQSPDPIEQPVTVDVGEAVALSVGRKVEINPDAPVAGTPEQLVETDALRYSPSPEGPGPDDELAPPIPGAPVGVPERVVQTPMSQSAEDEKSNLVQHAKKELALAGLDRQDADYGGGIAEAALEIIRVFARQGHSGASAALTIGVVSQLMAFEPLTPLTGSDYEWMQVGEGMWQNVRFSSVFKDETGRAYDIDGGVKQYPDGERSTMSTPVVFPYSPDRAARVVTLVDEDGNVL